MNKGSRFLKLSDKERDDLLERNRIVMKEQRKKYIEAWSDKKLYCTQCGIKLNKPKGECGWEALCKKCESIADKCERAYGCNSDYERLISGQKGK